MEKVGYSPATIYELLSWKKWNGRDLVVAFGSVVKVGGNRYVACLYRNDSERRLDLVWFVSDWDAVCRFLAVRK